MRLFYKISSYSLLFGIVHSALTPMFYKEINEDWFWFFATGFTLVFSGLMNLFAIYGNKKWMYTICVCANLIMLVWIVALNIVMKGKINALIVVLMYVGVLIGSVYYRFYKYSLDDS